MFWFSRSNSPARPSTLFGPLEWRVLEALWERCRPSSVRDLQPAFPDAAYTTLMTTLDRLHRKGVLERHKRGRAFFYETRMTRSELESARAAEALNVVLQGDAAHVGALMSFFVQAVSDRDRELLNELGALVKARREELERRKP